MITLNYENLLTEANLVADPSPPVAAVALTFPGIALSLFPVRLMLRTGLLDGLFSLSDL